VNGKPIKNNKPEIVHVRLPKSGDGVINKEYLNKVANCLKEKENDNTITVSEVIRRAIGIIIPTLDRDFSMADVLDILSDENFPIKRHIMDMKLTDIVGNRDINDMSLYDLLRLAMDNGLREKLNNLRFNEILMCVYNRALFLEKIEEQVSPTNL